MDELSKSIPGAEGMVDAEQGGKPKQHNEFCLNCGTKLQDTFCHHCGQKDIPRRQTLGELFSNFISSFWSYEGKFFLTTKYLILKPGFLAVEYNAGRRESYYHPARMYVFISFVFFLLFVSLPDSEGDKSAVEKTGKALDAASNKANKIKMDSLLSAIPMDDEDRAEILEELKKAKTDSLMRTLTATDSAGKGKVKKKKSLWNFGLQKAEYKSVSAYDSSQKAIPEKDRDGWLKKSLTVRAIELNNKYDGDGSKFAKDFGGAFKDNFSKVLFYLLPVFALLLKLLYVRRDFFYSEHLVFSIYYYNFFYLAGSLQMLINLVPALSWLSSILGFWIFFYLLFAMKRMYLQKWGKTIVKFTLFTIVFFFCALIALAVNAIAILMVI